MARLLPADGQGDPTAPSEWQRTPIRRQSWKRHSKSRANGRDHTRRGRLRKDMTNALSNFDAARRAIEKAASIDEVKAIRDRAEALRGYIRQSSQGLEMQNKCAEIKLRAERRAGELLAGMENQQPGQYQRLHDETVAPKLTELGISKLQSHRWQSISAIPQGAFDGHIAEIVGARRELTTTDALRLARELRQEEKFATIAETCEISDLAGC